MPDIKFPILHGRSYKDSTGRKVDILQEYQHPVNGKEFLGMVYEKNVIGAKRTPVRFNERGQVQYEGHDDPMRGFTNLVFVWDEHHELRLALQAAIKQVEKDFGTNAFFKFDSVSGVKFIPEPGTSPC